MIVTKDIAEIRELRWADPVLSWGLVPTMGYLHEGHLSLVRRASAENERVAASIYVNPTQFAPTDDLDEYPRSLERDLALLSAEGVDLVFVPDNEVMYPAGYQTNVEVTEVTKLLEGAARPEHFLGVATIVTKLFNIVQPTRAYFGQKDAQQVAVLRRLALDLNINTEVRVCPIVREADGLAMSSRNAYLSAEQRAAATVVSRALFSAEKALNAGERNAEALRTIMRQTLAGEPLANPDYVSLADTLTLEELEMVKDEALLSLAVYVGTTRLIDNLVWPRP